MQFNFGNQTKLVRTEFLPNINALSVFQFIINTLYFYNIFYKNVFFFISDRTSDNTNITYILYVKKFNFININTRKIKFIIRFVSSR
jgi:hypothetical protein